MNKIKSHILIPAVIILLLGFFGFYVFFKKDITETVMGNDSQSEEGFTFFRVGPHSRFSGNLRDELRKTLGSDAIETRTTINLEIHFPGFIRQHFPQIHQFNQKLNENANQRIEHNTTRLTYRYIPDRIKAFNYVELLFSNYSQLPLYCKIRGKDEVSDILDVLTSKYGEPEKIDWGRPEEFSLYWEYQGDVLIFSNVLDKAGNHEFQIMIYYVGNLEDLIIKEAQEKAAQEKEARNALKRVF